MTRPGAAWTLFKALTPITFASSAECRKPRNLAVFDVAFRHPSIEKQSTRRAIAVCRGGCPVVGQCLEWALDNKEAHGVWGGTTPQQRAAILNRRKTGAA